MGKDPGEVEILQLKEDDPNNQQWWHQKRPDDGYLGYPKDYQLIPSTSQPPEPLPVA